MREFWKKIPWQVKDIAVGLFLGGLAGYLATPDVNFTGICTSRMFGDIIGYLGIVRVKGFDYIPIELLGLIIGAFLGALIFKEFSTRRTASGASLIRQFLLGFIILFGAVAFVGCPFRMLIRFGSGDVMAIIGFFALAAGVATGTLFLKRGFSLGYEKKVENRIGYLIPALAMAAVLLIIIGFLSGYQIIGFVSKLYPFRVSFLGTVLGPLAAGLVIGFVAQRSRFCTISSIRDSILMKDLDRMVVIFAFILGAFIAMQLRRDFFFRDDNSFVRPGMLTAGLALYLVGLGSTYLGACPFRNLIKSGQGDVDALVVIVGMFLGAIVGYALGWGLLVPLTAWENWLLFAAIVGLLIYGFFRSRET